MKHVKLKKFREVVGDIKEKPASRKSGKKQPEKSVTTTRITPREVSRIASYH